jgi:PAS domain-containing protein
MEKVLPESVQTQHLSGPLSLHEWQQLFELAPFGIGVFDRDFRCRGVNGIFTELSGLAQGDHLGKTLFDITPDPGPPCCSSNFKQWLNGDTPRAELDLGTVSMSPAPAGRGAGSADRHRRLRHRLLFP